MKKEMATETDRERYYSITETAEILGMSYNHVKRHFVGRHGVKNYGTPATSTKSGRACYRIPQSAIEQYQDERETKRPA